MYYSRLNCYQSQLGYLYKIGQGIVSAFFRGLLVQLRPLYFAWMGPY